MMKEQSLDEAEGLAGAAEESPDQSISSAMPTDSGVGEGDGAPIVQDGMNFYFFFWKYNVNSLRHISVKQGIY